MPNSNIVSPNGIEYTRLAGEGKYFLSEKPSFIYHIKWQPRKLRHLNASTDAGVYSIGNDPDLAILYRVWFNSEFSEWYIRKDLSANNHSFEDIDTLKFIHADRSNSEYFNIMEETGNIIDAENFIRDIMKNEIITDENYQYYRNPFDLTAGNNGRIGYIFGFFHDIPNLAFPGAVWKDNDGQYYLIMDRRKFSISIELLKELGYEAKE
jgi:hypothetical protein